MQKFKRRLEFSPLDYTIKYRPGEELAMHSPVHSLILLPMLTFTMGYATQELCNSDSLLEKKKT